MTKILIPVLIGLFILSIGMLNENNAYAHTVHCSSGDTHGFKGSPVITSIEPTIDGAVIEWENPELRIGSSHNPQCFFPTGFEIEVDLEAPVNSPFFFDDEDIEGGSGGEYLLEGLECDTEYFVDIDGLWRSNSFGGRHIDGADESFTTLSCPAEHGEVVEVHCEVEYDWYQLFIFGEREGSGECMYVYEDDYVQEEEVEVSGGFITFGGTIDGTFNIVDGDDNALYMDEFGTLDTECEADVCLESDLIVTSGEGIFEDIGGEGNRQATIFITTDFFIFREGFAFSTIWIFFDGFEEEEVEEKDGGGGCTNCEPPTLGLNKQGDQRMVDGGFTCNGQTIDVGNYYTEFPTITNAVGQRLQCTFIIYEDTHADNVRHFEFAVGKRVDDYMSDEQGKIVWDRDFKLVETVTYDSELFRNVYVLSSLAKCLDASDTATCLKLELSATPKMPLVDEIIVKTNVWDERRNAKQNFYNDGIDFVGITENTLPFFKVVDGRNGITTIYTTDFTLEDQTHAIDMYGNTWTLTNNIWNKDYVAPNTSCDVSTYIGYDRTCPEFAIMKQGQALMGTQYFDSSKIQSTVDDAYTFEYPEQTDRLAGTQLG